MPEESTAIKKPRVRKPTVPQNTMEEISPATTFTTKEDIFSLLINQIFQTKSDLEKLQKEMIDTKAAWAKEQKDHQLELAERNQQEELIRQREKESYSYNLAREHKKAEDEFADKKMSWEKQLREQKEMIEKDRADLQELRKLASNFEAEKEKAVNEALTALQKELTEKSDFEKRLREQEVKSEKEILSLKISSLTSENSKQAAEIDHLKKALEDTTKQVREIAVKVIESGSNAVKNFQEG